MNPSERLRGVWNIVKAPERNRYHHGMLMTDDLFRRETDYLNAKRYLLNRLVAGYGVVCGLNVLPGDEANQIWIAPGVAIDKWGREIIVPRQAGPITIPDDVLEEAVKQQLAEHYQRHHGYHDKMGCVTVLVCYHECETDPTPTLAGDCSSHDPCMPSTIREQFEICFEAGCREPRRHTCEIPDTISNGRINYAELVEWVTRRDCFELPENPCIRLAEIVIEEGRGHHCDEDFIHIDVRPLCYVNDLLYELALGLIQELLGGRPQK